MPKKQFTADEILENIRSQGAKLGRSPTLIEFSNEFQISDRTVRQRFDTWRQAVWTAGLVPDLSRQALDPGKMLADWGRVTQILGRIPTVIEYERHGQYGNSTFFKHFGLWSKMPKTFRDFARDKPEFAEILKLVPENHVSRIRRRSISFALDNPLAAARRA